MENALCSFQYNIATLCVWLAVGAHQNVRSDSGVGHGMLGNRANERQVHLDPRMRQTQEQERATINTALLPPVGIPISVPRWWLWIACAN